MEKLWKFYRGNKRLLLIIQLFINSLQALLNSISISFFINKHDCTYLNQTIDSQSNQRVTPYNSILKSSGSYFFFCLLIILKSSTAPPVSISAWINLLTYLLKFFFDSEYFSKSTSTSSAKSKLIDLIFRFSFNYCHPLRILYFRFREGLCFSLFLKETIHCF